MKKSMRLGSLCLALCLALSLAYAKMIESEKERLPSQKQRIEKIQTRVNELHQKLDLNSEQVRAVTEILTRTKEATMKLLEEAGGKILELKKKGEEEIQALLTEEQKGKLQGIAEETEEEDILKIFRGY